MFRAEDYNQEPFLSLSRITENFPEMLIVVFFFVSVTKVPSMVPSINPPTLS